MGAIGADSERKIATAIALFEDNVDHERLRERLDVARPTRVTPLMFEQRLLERARTDRRHIVLPESGDDRILRVTGQPAPASRGGASGGRLVADSPAHVCPDQR
jgi:phosphate acetyltransferase